MMQSRNRIGLLVAVLAVLFGCLCLPSVAREKFDKEKMDKVIKENLCGSVVSSKSNPAPGSLQWEPLEGVEIRLEGTKYKTTTEAFGAFAMKVKPGTYTLVASKPGVGLTTKTVTVTDGPTPTMVNIVLTPGKVGDNIDPRTGGSVNTLSPGTCYVAYAQKSLSGNPNSTASMPSSIGMGLNTTQSYKQAILLGADPLRMNAFNTVMPSLNQPTNMGMTSMQTSPTSVALNNLMIIDKETPNEPRYVDMVSQPYWMCFNAPGNHLFVSTNGNSLQVYDTSNGNNLMTTLPLGGVVTDLKLSLDGNYIMAAVMSAQPTIMLIDPRTNTPQRSLPLPMMRTGQAGQPRGVASNREFTRIFVAMGTQNSGEVVAIDPMSGVAQNALPVGMNPTDMAISPDGRFLYVVNSGSGDVSVIDAWMFTEMGRIRVGASPQKVAISPDGQRVFVTNKASDSVSIINGSSQAVIGTIPTGRAPVGIACSSLNDRVYVGCTGTGNVTILDAKSGGALMNTTSLQNSTPWGIAVRP
ncbi:carboxypeptidase regulatory-like domain-containing protein [bacterium]|nr:carboxypeptidase regulatory-like domain-containing protein [bacterium]